MRFDPWKCPECDQAAAGTVEVIYGVALLVFTEDGNAEYEGQTDIDWDSQTTVLGVDGRATLECPSGHRWQAAAKTGPDNQQ